MRFSEAMKALEEGKRVRPKYWHKDCFLCRGSDGTIVDAAKSSMFCIEEWSLMEWELYEEPEKTYTFMEVVQGLKEGKRFKRKDWGDWFLAYSQCTYIEGKGIPPCFAPFTIENFEANDWIEVK